MLPFVYGRRLTGESTPHLVSLWTTNRPYLLVILATPRRKLSLRTGRGDLDSRPKDPRGLRAKPLTRKDVGSIGDGASAKTAESYRDQHGTTYFGIRRTGRQSFQDGIRRPKQGVCGRTPRRTLPRQLQYPDPDPSPLVPGPLPCYETPGVLLQEITFVTPG